MRANPDSSAPYAWWSATAACATGPAPLESAGNAAIAVATQAELANLLNDPLLIFVRHELAILDFVVPKGDRPNPGALGALEGKNFTGSIANDSPLKF